MGNWAYIIVVTFMLALLEPLAIVVGWVFIADSEKGKRGRYYVGKRRRTRRWLGWLRLHWG